DGLIVVFDSDAHPIRSGWLDFLVAELRTHDLVAARDDTYDQQDAHPCVTAFFKSVYDDGLRFRDFRHDVGRMMSAELRRRGRPLRLLEFDKLWPEQGRLYEGTFYHHSKSSWLNPLNRSLLSADWFDR